MIYLARAPNPHSEQVQDGILGVILEGAPRRAVVLSSCPARVETSLPVCHTDEPGTSYLGLFTTAVPCNSLLLT